MIFGLTDARITWQVAKLRGAADEENGGGGGVTATKRGVERYDG